jgi:PAS domain S-box-containing protein
MYGWKADEAIGRPVSILVPPHRAGEERRILAKILAGDRVEHYETERVTKDGREIVVSLTVSPIRNDEGEIEAASVIARDVTRQRRTLELAERLREATSVLSREITPDRVLEGILDQMVGAMGAAAGAVGLLDGDEIAVAGSRGHNADRIGEWQRFPVDSPLPMSEVIKTGQPVWSVTSDELRERFPVFATGEVPFEGLAVLPLSTGDETFGAVSLSFKEVREFTPEAKSFFIAAVQQAAYALERARAYEGERVAARRQRFLAEAGELLSESLDPDEALSRLAAIAVRYIADWCAVDVIDDNGNLESIAVAHEDPEQVEFATWMREKYPPDPAADRGAWRVIRTGESELYPRVPDELLVESAQDSEHLEAIRNVGIGSVIIVPLIARGRTLGSITLVSREEGRYGQLDVAIAEDLARRAGLALDNALLYRREHEAAITLQRSLLPQAVPREHGDMTFEVRYSPAGPGVEVGGDWYEVVALDDGAVGVTIGDVAGRGIKAASIMGRIRPALRAFVMDGHGPCEAVARLDHSMRESELPQMATVFHLQYQPRSGIAEYVRAGHPPALVRTPDGEIHELRGGGTPPLGILRGVECTQHEFVIPRGSLLLLYTDGLIERRGVDLTSALAELKATFAEGPREPRACLDWIEKSLRAGEVEDDVAMLAMATGRNGSNGSH